MTTLICQRCAAPLLRIDASCAVCGSTLATRAPGISSKTPKLAEAVSFDRGVTFRAVVQGSLQRPEFNAKGPALIFAQQVLCGKRPPEPIELMPRLTHQRLAALERRNYWMWRARRVVENCKRPGFSSSAAALFGDQAAYCLDRPYDLGEMQ